MRRGGAAEDAPGTDARSWDAGAGEGVALQAGCMGRGRGREAPGLGCTAGRSALGLERFQTWRPGDHRSLVPCSSRVSSVLDLAMAAAVAAAAAEELPPPPGSRGTC